MLIQYSLKTLDQQAGQDAMNLVTGTLMDFLADREKQQKQLAMGVAGRSQI